MIEIKCKFCGKGKYIKPYRLKRSKNICCSVICKNKLQTGTICSEESRIKRSTIFKGENNPFYGKHHSLRTKEKISVAKRENPIRYWLGKKRPEMSGEKNWNWLGGKTPENEKIRKSLEYKIWQRKCLKRDDYRCFDCGQKGGKLEVDHIYPFALYPRLRFMLENGRTLCKDCHKKTKTYLYNFPKVAYLTK